MDVPIPPNETGTRRVARPGPGIRLLGAGNQFS
jgi:hypothetical protein